MKTITLKEHKEELEEELEEYLEKNCNYINSSDDVNAIKMDFWFQKGIQQEFRRILDLMIEIENRDKFETFITKWNSLKKQLQQEKKQ